MVGPKLTAPESEEPYVTARRHSSSMELEFGTLCILVEKLNHSLICLCDDDCVSSGIKFTILTIFNYSSVAVSTFTVCAPVTTVYFQTLPIVPIKSVPVKH